VEERSVVATTVGYVGTFEVESRGVSRMWFSLTAAAQGAEWVKIGANRAWFTMNLESTDRPFHMAQGPVLLEAMRSGLQIQVSHDGAANFFKRVAGDSFEVDGIRVLRLGLHF
jgi:hypothetical protein